LPAAASGRQAVAEGPPRVTVNVLADGRIMLGSLAAPRTEVAPRLRQERDRAGDNLEVRIRADRAVPYAAVEPVLVACAEAGIWNVTFAVFKKVEGRGSRVESQN